MLAADARHKLSGGQHWLVSTDNPANDAREGNASGLTLPVMLLLQKS